MSRTLARSEEGPKEPPRERTAPDREGQARIIHGCRSEAAETEARRGSSQLRTTQAYSKQYVEEAEGKEPRQARGSVAAVGIHG